MPRRLTLPLAALSLILTLATPLSAREVVVVFKTGNSITGRFVSETADSVTINVRGQEQTFPRTVIAEMKVQLSLAEDFRDRRQKLDDADHDGRYTLARHFYDRGKQLIAERETLQAIEAFRLARGELLEVLKAKPGWERAKLLQETIDEQLRAVGAAPVPPTPRPPTPPTPTPPTPPTPPPGNGTGTTGGGEIKLLTREQVNLVKVYEIDLSVRPRVVVPDDVIDQVLTSFRDDPLLKPYIGQRGRAKIRTLRPHEQLQLLFDLKARSLYDKVLVRDEPLNMRNFRTRYHPNYVVRYCGSCHTDGKAAGLNLVTKRPSLEATAYTNLLILRRTPAEPVPIIFKSDPERSLLLQYGLPQREATTPHPVVRGKMVWRNKFRGRRDPLYIDMFNWIRSLYGEAEGYPIEFTVPRPAGSAPAEADPLEGPPATPAPGTPPSPPAPTAGGT